MKNLLLILLVQLSFEVNGVSFQMNEVPGGTYTMGGTAEQKSDLLTDKPTHPVSIPTFYIGETEVTQRLWRAVMGKEEERWAADDCPMVSISWFDCQEFIRRLDSITGEDFRFPTEAEWEFAARGGNTEKATRFAGSNHAEEVGWVYRNSGGRVHAVAQKTPNELGLYDMTGNVREWCADTFRLYSSEAEIQPILHFSIDTTRAARIQRGGSWDNAVDNIHLSARNIGNADDVFLDCGLRLALSKKPRLGELKAKQRVYIGIHCFHFDIVAGDSTHSPYYIADRDITRQEYRQIMRVKTHRNGKGTYPITGLTEAEVKAFLWQLSNHSGLHFRLPDLSEWERQRKEEDVLQNNHEKDYGKKVSYRRRKAIKKANMWLSLVQNMIPVVPITIPEPDDVTLLEYNEYTADTQSHFLQDISNSQPEQRLLRLVLVP